ncbi:hypothetical protein HYH03_017620 [Edaphochlamys debaryana]|uniref:Glycerophosphocholine acyltransferase 1 n=1 Tax=Edaphochlamys debaryana TaxID=47281 RepID=A0A835XG87_9CHLO|nr:hypothetical protein HYH03_017620 [Edaphochlamys debaryana]|eukprot:KAG2483513.1 hypothetical protein HYH03_017620 [Edaphochlamys debaryana]
MLGGGGGAAAEDSSFGAEAEALEAPSAGAAAAPASPAEAAGAASGAASDAHAPASVSGTISGGGGAEPSGEPPAAEAAAAVAAEGGGEVAAAGSPSASGTPPAPDVAANGAGLSPADDGVAAVQHHPDGDAVQPRPSLDESLYDGGDELCGCSDDELALGMDSDFGFGEFLDAVESFAVGGGGGGGADGGEAEEVAAAAEALMRIGDGGIGGGGGLGAVESDARVMAAAALGCLNGTGGDPSGLLAEAVVDLAAPAQALGGLPGGVEERREAATKQERRRILARLRGLRLFRRALGPRGLLLKDKISFLLGTSMMWTCAFWLGRSPASFHLLYGGLGGVLLGARWALYWHRKWHYYLFDFCYYANLLLALQLTLLPRWAPLAKVTFAYTTGPLSWSVLTFRNSLVFHDLDKVTSLFLHLVPALVSYTQRWHVDPRRFGPPPDAPPDERSAWMRAGVVSNVLLPMAFYVAWAVAYYLKIFVFSRAKIQQRGYKTLFNYITTQKKGTFHAIARRIPPPLQPPVYLLLHLCFCAATFVVALGFWAHSVLLAAVASASVWHGGAYYFEVFARRYHTQLMPSSSPSAPHMLSPGGAHSHPHPHPHTPGTNGTGIGTNGPGTPRPAASVLGSPRPPGPALSSPGPWARGTGREAPVGAGAGAGVKAKVS